MHGHTGKQGEGKRTAEGWAGEEEAGGEELSPWATSVPTSWLGLSELLWARKLTGSLGQRCHLCSDLALPGEGQAEHNLRPCLWLPGHWKSWISEAIAL